MMNATKIEATNLTNTDKYKGKATGEKSGISGDAGAANTTKGNKIVDLALKVVRTAVKAGERVLTEVYEKLAFAPIRNTLEFMFDPTNSKRIKYRKMVVAIIPKLMSLSYMRGYAFNHLKWLAEEFGLSIGYISKVTTVMAKAGLIYKCLTNQQHYFVNPYVKLHFQAALVNIANGYIPELMNTVDADYTVPEIAPAPGTIIGEVVASPTAAPTKAVAPKEKYVPKATPAWLRAKQEAEAKAAWELKVGGAATNFVEPSSDQSVEELKAAIAKGEAIQKGFDNWVASFGSLGLLEKIAEIKAAYREFKARLGMSGYLAAVAAEIKASLNPAHEEWAGWLANNLYLNRV